MKIDVVKVTENEDGSASIGLDFDAEALQFVIQAFMTRALNETVASYEQSLDSSDG